MPRISVLIGIYNCAPYLQEALDSLYAQTYQDFKIILCDDGSNDDTYAIAQHNAEEHSNIVLIKNERNMGLNYTLNHCLEHADTEYIARMDGDDISLPTRFEKEIAFLDAHPEYAVVSVPMIYFDESGDFRTGKGSGEVKAEDFINGTPICHAPCMARTAVIKSVGGYSVDDRLLRVEDYHLWFKVFSAGNRLYMMNEPLYKMRDDRNAEAGLVTAMAARMAGIPHRTHIFTGQVWATKQGFSRWILKAIDKLIAGLDNHILVDGKSQRSFLVKEGVLKEGQAEVFCNGSIAAGFQCKTYQ